MIKLDKIQMFMDVGLLAMGADTVTVTEKLRS